MYRRNFLKLFSSFCLLLMLSASLLPIKNGHASGNAQVIPQDKAAELMAHLTPEEKVGQLMLVTFRGTDVSENSNIYDLITKYHVGGVVLKRADDNFVGPDNTLTSAWELISNLQTEEFQSSRTEIQNPETNESFSPSYIPLFVGISQEGDGYPYSEIINGLTPLPNEMTLGATWNPSYAEQVGEILGTELSALGVNLLLGPSLDILEDPSPDDTGNLGTRTFGGDPFWVGEFGQAYIRGVHDGSSNRMMLVGKYFPGRGSSDRPPEEEVATIRKTLEQLKQTDLAPFFAVTGDAPDAESTVDALLTSHIKYQGFQTNIRSTTRPISFDPQAFNQLMSLPAFSVWRTAGGIMVSDDLGTKAVRRFFSPSGEVFNARFVARDALLAGNDLLYLGDFISSEDTDSYTTIIRTLDFFAVKYREDPAFAQRVDEAVMRILTQKFKIYGDFQLDRVLTSQSGLEQIGQDDQITFEIARQAATLISPSPDDLDNVLPNPPSLSDNIVFITDSYNVNQCSACPDQPVLEDTTLQDAVLRLYGPESGAQVNRRNMLSFSFENLQTMLDRGINRTEVEFHIKNAQWLVITMLDVREQRPLSLALKRFLDERPDLLRDKQVIVFALNAPYYLDATDISKLTAYYALYSKSPQSIDVAARLLYNEIRPLPGSLPVSVNGVGYDLFQATTPNSDQVIPLFLDMPNSKGTPVPEEVTPAPPPEFQVGDLVPVQTGVIIDHNNNPVPDNTEVHFYLSTVGERSVVVKEIIANTTAGIARATFPIETQGNLVITAHSEPATQSESIPITIAGERPTITPSATNEPTQTLTPSETPTSITLIGTITTPNSPSNQGRLINWLLAIAIGLIVSWMAYRFSITLGQVRWSMRIGFCVLIGGLVVYIYFASGLPGGSWLAGLGGLFAGAMATLLGNSLGFAAALIWKNSTQ
jgi:beta-N-acetylhexosaminidase